MCQYCLCHAQFYLLNDVINSTKKERKKERKKENEFSEYHVVFIYSSSLFVYEHVTLRSSVKRTGSVSANWHHSDVAVVIKKSLVDLRFLKKMYF